MEVFDFFEKTNIPKNTALCLGNFDGVHLGHRRLFDVARSFGSFGVLVFDGNFKGDKLLTNLSEKLEIIEKLGADYVICVKPTSGFLGITGEDFYDKVVNEFGVDMLVAGYDFRFGRGAFHTSDDLEKWSRRDGVRVHIEDEYVIEKAAVKSSRIRELIASGKMEPANRLLGYYYSLSGIVEKGLKNGRKMGFPTANIAYDSEKLLPPDGVYKGKIYLENEEKIAVINIGKNPTFDAVRRTVEVHIPGFDGDIYGKEVKVEFLEKIRDEIHFDTVDELVERIKKDVEYALK